MSRGLMRHPLFCTYVLSVLALSTSDALHINWSFTYLLTCLLKPVWRTAAWRSQSRSDPTIIWGRVKTIVDVRLTSPASTRHHCSMHSSHMTSAGVKLVDSADQRLAMCLYTTQSQYTSTATSNSDFTLLHAQQWAYSYTKRWVIKIGRYDKKSVSRSKKNLLQGFWPADWFLTGVYEATCHAKFSHSEQLLKFLTVILALFTSLTKR